MDAARRLLRGLWLLEATVCVLAFSITAVALMADVLGREFFGNGIFGAQRLAVWTTAIAGLVGFALVTAEGGHLRPRFMDGWLPKSAEPYIGRIGELVSAIDLHRAGLVCGGVRAQLGRARGARHGHPDRRLADPADPAVDVLLVGAAPPVLCDLAGLKPEPPQVEH